MKLEILSGGAAQGLVGMVARSSRPRPAFEIGGTFGAVGAMRDKLLAGAPADVLILTAALIAELDAQRPCGGGLGRRPRRRAHGHRRAQRRSSARVGDAASLRAALMAADAIYFPDPKLATAGIHFAKVLDQLGLRDAVADPPASSSQRRDRHARDGGGGGRPSAARR